MSHKQNAGAVVAELTEELKEYIDQRDTAVEHRIKLWVFGSILTQIIALLPVIFFLGGIYSDGRSAVKMLEEQQNELRQRGTWMQDRERWEMTIEIWAKQNGYEPPRHGRPARQQ